MGTVSSWQGAGLALSREGSSCGRHAGQILGGGHHWAPLRAGGQPGAPTWSRSDSMEHPRDSGKPAPRLEDRQSAEVPTSCDPQIEPRDTWSCKASLRGPRQGLGVVSR